MNERQMAALVDFRAAYAFREKCREEGISSTETGAWDDARQWMKEAEKELYEATEGLAV